MPFQTKFPQILRMANTENRIRVEENSGCNLLDFLLKLLLTLLLTRQVSEYKICT